MFSQQNTTVGKGGGGGRVGWVFGKVLLVPKQSCKASKGINSGGVGARGGGAPQVPPLPPFAYTTLARRLKDSHVFLTQVLFRACCSYQACLQRFKFALLCILMQSCSFFLPSF